MRCITASDLRTGVCISSLGFAPIGSIAPCANLGRRQTEPKGHHDDDAIENRADYRCFSAFSRCGDRANQLLDRHECQCAANQPLLPKVHITIWLAGTAMCSLLPACRLADACLRVRTAWRWRKWLFGWLWHLQILEWQRVCRCARQAAAIEIIGVSPYYASIGDTCDARRLTILARHTADRSERPRNVRRPNTDTGRSLRAAWAR